MAKLWLLLLLAAVVLGFAAIWAAAILVARRERAGGVREPVAPRAIDHVVGFLTNFFDTLGIGSFATTTAVYKLKHLVDDRLIPGTLNVGHTIPVVVQAFIYIAIVQVDFITLVLLIVAAVAGAWLGAGVVASWPRRKIQIGMGSALIVAAALMLMTQLDLFPGAGVALQLGGIRLAAGIAGNFVLGALMTLGIGLYAPCMILVSLLGMNPTAAFPIMMGSCAFLMPVGGTRFIRKQSYSLRAALGLTIGGIPGVLIAAYLVTSLPLGAVRWLVIAVVLYTATMMLRSALAENRATAMQAPAPESA
jgi:uncharacterized membrane protein YfcA